MFLPSEQKSLKYSVKVVYEFENYFSLFILEIIRIMTRLFDSEKNANIEENLVINKLKGKFR